MDFQGDQSDVTRVLELAASGDAAAAEDLLPLVYDHLRVLAAQRLARESPGNTLQPTALVHEAYVRIAGSRDSKWNGKKHFFAAAALAMRRILVDRARTRKSQKRGGGLERVPLELAEEAAHDPPDADNVNWIVLEAALQTLAKTDPALAEVVNLRYFAGLSIDETANVLGTSPRSVDRDWQVAKAWLLREIGRGIAT